MRRDLPAVVGTFYRSIPSPPCRGRSQFQWPRAFLRSRVNMNIGRSETGINTAAGSLHRSNRRGRIREREGNIPDSGSRRCRRPGKHTCKLYMTSR